MEVTWQRLQIPERGRGQNSEISSFRKRAVLKLPALIPLHSVVAPSQFSRDLKQHSFCALHDTGSPGARGGGRGKGETVQTAWPPSCLCPRFARAPFSVTHASPSPPPCLGLCIARLRRSAGAAPTLPGLLSRGV